MRELLRSATYSPLRGAADENVVRLVELAWCRSLSTPLFDEFALRGELHHPGIASGVWLVAVGDEDVAVVSDGDPGRPIEGIDAAAGDAHLAEHQQHLAILIELKNLLAHLHAIFVPGRHAQHCFMIVDIADP